MAHVTFTPNLRRHLQVAPADVDGGSVREVLERFFATHPEARGFVLDDQGALRHHMVVFIDGRQVEDRVGLSDRVPEGGQVYVMQALSGG